MAITQETLDGLIATGYGPLAMERTGQGHVATMEGRHASIVLERQAVRIQTAARVDWPAGENQEEVNRRVQLALAQVALSRPELLSIVGDRASSSTYVSVWIDGEGSGPAELALAVRTAILMSDISRDAVDQVRLNLQSERQLLEATQEAPAAVKDAEAAVGEYEQAEAVERQAVAQAQAPSAAVPSTGAPPAGNDAGRFCTSCGTSNPGQNKFCTKCGGALG